MDKKLMNNLQPPQRPIHLNPTHKGEFTAWAKAHGFSSVQVAASHVMANKEKYPKHVVQMAVFAHNFGK
jgi:hypothetical protein